MVSDSTYRKEVGLVVYDWAGKMVDFGCQAPVGALFKGSALDK